MQGITEEVGGDEGDRTPYLNAASVALYQMSYVPMCSKLAFQRFPTDKFRGGGVTKQALGSVYIIPSTYTGKKFGLLNYLTKVKNNGKD